MALIGSCYIWDTHSAAEYGRSNLSGIHSERSVNSLLNVFYSLDKSGANIPTSERWKAWAVRTVLPERGTSSRGALGSRRLFRLLYSAAQSTVQLLRISHRCLGLLTWFNNLQISTDHSPLPSCR